LAGMSACDSIAAIATAPGVGGVGIIRVSGPLAPAIAEGVLGRVPPPRTALHCAFRGADGEIIDTGLALYFPAPRSFTGEDVLELQGHGGPVVLDLLLQHVLGLGARPARAGEFSERAFLEGKLDLSRAEAIADLIESATAAQARLAVRTLQGELARRVDALLESLTRLRAFVEASFDFPDDDIDVLADSNVQKNLTLLIHSINDLLSAAQRGERVRNGMLVVIAGPPNAGKSSLLNVLSGRDTAIVTAIPGTTRDLLNADIEIDGLPIRVVDTAGIRISADPIEREGIRRAREQIEQADRVLWITDDRAPPGTDTLPEPLPATVPVTHVRNKIDLTGRRAGIRPGVDGGTEILCSAKTGDGLDALRAHLKATVGYHGAVEGAFSARRRHLDALIRTRARLTAAQEALAGGGGPELAAEDLRLAQQSLGEITGAFAPDDLLGRIFSEFCIGK
jgi:tRNA modification GTPase